MSDRPKTIREAFDRIDRASEAVRGGRPGKPLAGSMMWLYCQALLDAIEILKATEPDRLLHAVWAIERDTRDLQIETARRLTSEVGPEALLAALLGRDGPPGDGDSLDIRPPRRGGR